MHKRILECFLSKIFQSSAPRIYLFTKNAALNSYRPIQNRVAYNFSNKNNQHKHLKLSQKERKDKVQRIFPPGIAKPIAPYSPLTAVGNLIFVSGQIPTNPQTGSIDQQDIEWQAHRCMLNLKTVLEGANITFSDVAKCTILLINMADFGKINAIYESYFEKGKYPARVCYGVAALPKDSKIQIQVIAVRQQEKSHLKSQKNQINQR